MSNTKILAYNTWKIKVNFIVSDPETVITDQFLTPETDTKHQFLKRQFLEPETDWLQELTLHLSED